MTGLAEPMVLTRDDRRAFDDGAAQYEARHGLMHRCPICHAPPGKRCRDGKRLTEPAHLERFGRVSFLLPERRGLFCGRRLWANGQGYDPDDPRRYPMRWEAV